MLKKSISTIAALAIYTTAATAQDASGLYAGAGVATISTKDDESTFSSTNINALVGYEINSYFAVEGEISFVVREDSITVQGTNVDVGLSHSGVFARANLMPSNSQFVPFVRVGYVRGTVEATVLGVSASLEDEAFSIGLGGEYKFSDTSSVRLDVGRSEFEFEGEKTEATLVSFLNVYRF